MSKNTNSTLPEFKPGDIVWIRQPRYEKHWSDGGKEANTVIRTVKVVEIHCHMKPRNPSRIDYIGYYCEMVEPDGTNILPVNDKREITWFHEDCLFRSLDEAMNTKQYREGSSKIYNYRLLERNRE